MAAAIQSIVGRIDQGAVSASAKAETRNREHHLPPISVYRWWARRTDAVNGALLDAAQQELAPGGRLMVADPFAGGGVIPLAALKRGHAIYAQDLNPWVLTGLRAMLELPHVEELRVGGRMLETVAAKLIRRAYATTFADGMPAEIAHTMRVAWSRCSHCDHEHPLFPHALVSLTRRRDRDGKEAYLACPQGHLFLAAASGHATCRVCLASVDTAQSYLVDRLATCPNCGRQDSLDTRAKAGWDWRVALVERSDAARRELGIPTSVECLQADGPQWKPQRRLGAIPDTSETRVLIRHGFKTWADLYPARQRVVMEELLKKARALSVPENTRSAVTMAVLGTAEMAGLLSRWDRFYMKSFESMASHRFNFTTFTVEPNVLGAGLDGRGTFRRRLRLYERASRWSHENSTLRTVHMYSAVQQRLETADRDGVTLVEGSSERMLLPDGSVDVVLTDPPYHDDVQYHELSLPLRAWANLGRSRATGDAVAIPHSASLRGHQAYRKVLQRVFGEFRRVLRPGGRLLFSYANREPAAWVNLFSALKNAGFQPVGYTILHSENEADHAKRSGRSCALDMILELTPTSDATVEVSKPKQVFGTDEEAYLLTVGDAFLRCAALSAGWETTLVESLKAEVFVKRRKRLSPENVAQLTIAVEAQAPGQQSPEPQDSLAA